MFSMFVESAVSQALSSTMRALSAENLVFRLEFPNDQSRDFATAVAKLRIPLIFEWNNRELTVPARKLF
jgi:hypothetical protein